MNEDLSKLGLAELYDLLEPIVAPPDIPLTPQTTGWVVVGVGVLALLAFIAARLVKQHKANAYRRAALAELARAGDDPAAIAQVLRRTAIAAFPRAQVAGLHGADWLGFLDTSSPKTRFSSSPEGNSLLCGPYQSTPAAPDLNGVARRWILSHTSSETAP